MNTAYATLLCITCIGIGHAFLIRDNPKKITVSTPVGDVIGLEKTTFINSNLSYKIQSYLGIPYAESPTGNLRFKKPVPKANFATPFDGSKQGPICYQAETPFSTKTTRSEDCLRVNVYVPITKDTQLKPVMFWIHGGGFVNGGNDMFDGSVLSGFGDVIVVIINYRLSYFGFFTTGDSTAPGNFGLWDQQLALQWTIKNIQSFGGDPNRITVFGESAGGSAVIFQTFYPGNKGLFKHAIAESGTIDSPWAFAEKATNVDYSKKFATAAGCHQQTHSDYTACLRALPAHVLNSTINTMQDSLSGPVLDHAFIQDTPDNLLSGNSNATSALEMFHSVDLIIGYNSGDGMLDFFAWMFTTKTFNPMNFNMPKSIYDNDIMKHYIQVYYNITNVSESARLVTLHEYTDWTNPLDDRKRVTKLLDIATDYYLGVSSVATAVRHVKDNVVQTTTYTYEFAVQPLPSLDLFPVPPVISGPEVCKHADEINFVFGRQIEKVSEDPTQINQYNTYLATMTMWSNFAKSGNPNIPNDITKYTVASWPKFTTHGEYLRITPVMTAESAKMDMRARAVDFWTNTLPSVMKK